MDEDIVVLAPQHAKQDGAANRICVSALDRNEPDLVARFATWAKGWRERQFFAAPQRRKGAS
ncbi:MAG TPA: hypothetical protein VGI70_04705 [Polyangiales bacterium]|jgi:hypothetical protein